MNILKGNKITASKSNHTGKLTKSNNIDELTMILIVKRGQDIVISITMTTAITTKEKI